MFLPLPMLEAVIESSLIQFLPSKRTQVQEKRINITPTILTLEEFF